MTSFVSWIIFDFNIVQGTGGTAQRSFEEIEWQRLHGFGLRRHIIYAKIKKSPFNLLLNCLIFHFKEEIRAIKDTELNI